MPTFLRKPAIVQAVQWTGDDASWEAVRPLHADSELVAFREDNGTISIETTGGRVQAQTGDWIIKDSVGEFCVCKPDALATNYKPHFHDYLRAHPMHATASAARRLSIFGTCASGLGQPPAMRGRRG